MSARRPDTGQIAFDLATRLDAFESSAVFSDDRRYRYALRRTWDRGSPPLGFAMLNGSTAGESDNDPTITRCMGFARSHGYGGIRVVNLFGWAATDPRQLAVQRGLGVDVVGPDNDRWFWSETEGISVCAAWGSSVPAYWHARAKSMGWLLRQDRTAYHLGLTKHGWPRHPLYLPASSRLQRWPADGDR